MTAVVEGLPGIGLEELIGAAELQTRRERKYLVPIDAADAVLDGIQARVLEIDGLRTFRYESIYFDTSARDSFLGSARRRRRRFKARTRAYLDSGDCMLEVKVRDNRGNTVKHRQPYDLDSRTRLTDEAVAFLGGITAVAPHALHLDAAITVAYRRCTLMLDTGPSRVTIDRGATWSTDDAATLSLRGLVLIETKTMGQPSAVDRALWRSGHRPVAISKYCVGLALTEHSLPSNKWHRLLGRDVVPNLEVRA